MAAGHIRPRGHWRPVAGRGGGTQCTTCINGCTREWHPLAGCVLMNISSQYQWRPTAQFISETHFPCFCPRHAATVTDGGGEAIHPCWPAFLHLLMELTNGTSSQGGGENSRAYKPSSCAWITQASTPVGRGGGRWCEINPREEEEGRGQELRSAQPNGRSHQDGIHTPGA